jgi:hypothetical protein
MSVRAYKIAEELGIERNEFVDKAREFGVELRNAMAPLDEEQVTLLREKLSIKTSDLVTEARVERKGRAVIRRRKKVAPAEPPTREPEPPAPASPEAESAVQADGTPAEDAVPEPGAPAEPEVPLAPEPEPEAVRPAAAAAAPSTGSETPREGTTRPRPPARDDAAAERQTRKQFKEVVNLREQEQIARQVTSRSGIRQTVIDPRAYTNPRRKRRDALPLRRPADTAAKAQ